MINENKIKILPLGLKKVVKLLNTLDKKDKKNIIQWFSTEKSETKYSSLLLLLWEWWFENQPNILDEEALYIQLKRKKIVMTTNNIKRSIEVSNLSNELYQAIFRYIRNTERKNMGRNLLYSLLKEIDWLYQYKVYDICWDTIEKAEKIAVKLELHAIILELSYYKKKLLLNSATIQLEDLENTYEAIFQQDKTSLAFIQDYHELIFIRLNFNYNGVTNDKFLKNNFFEKNQNYQNTESFELKLLYHANICFQILSKKNLTESDKDMIIEHYKSSFDLFSEPRFKLFLDSDPQRYLLFYHNFVIYASRINRHEEIPDIDFELFFKKYNLETEIETLLFINNILIIKDIYQKKWKSAQSRIKKYGENVLLKLFEQHRNSILTNHYIAYAYNILLVQLINTEQQKAHDWCNLILNETFREISIEHILLVRYIQVLLLHKDQHSNLDMILRNIREYAKRHEKLSPVHQCLHDCFNEYLFLPPSKTNWVVLQKHKEKLETLTKNDHTLKTYHIFLAWMDTEITQQPLIETIEKYL